MATRKHRRPTSRGYQLPDNRRGGTAAAVISSVPSVQAPSRGQSQFMLAVAGVVAVVGLVGYWPTIADLVGTWSREAEYSHGFIVAPVAVLMLWVRRSTFPGLGQPAPLLAIGFALASVAMRYFSGRFFYTFLDGWSLIPWAACIAALLGGRRLLVWSMPAIGFLFFMVPLPFAIEGQLSYPLQRIATLLSTTTLQLFGFAAFADGNVILLGSDRLEVAQACSGLRLFVSVVALTYVYMTIVPRPWRERIALAIAAVPVAIISNVARIVVTGMVFHYSGEKAVRDFVHDSAGWGTILFAAGLFWALLWYLGKLICQEDVMDAGALVRIARREPALAVAKEAT